ncbi:hypothetical protein [Acinetobacter sp. YH12251]|uniref:hypothetical protein n=1 Tax=Acinetobacter sp. YH12251 TaxID=2601176 RepID=UPI0015D16735|nr:hypothetical protein [Acinetobacter sp. YH12251]
MDIQNNAIVIDADTEALDSQITQISNDFAETYYLDNEQQEELEMLVAKAMKLGELYERQKWQAKAQAVPEGFVLVPRQPNEKTLIKMSWSVVLGEDQHGNSVYLSIDEAKQAYEAVIKAQEQGQ